MTGARADASRNIPELTDLLPDEEVTVMNSIIYIIGLIVVIGAVLSFIGLG